MLKTVDNTTMTIHCNGDNPLLIEAGGENYTYVAILMCGEKDAPSPNQAWDENGVDLGMIAAEKADKQYEELKANVEKEVEEKMRQEQETESAIVDEVPLDSDGDVTMDYYHNVIPDTFLNPANETVVDFGAIVEVPHFCPDEHLFRAEIDHDGTTWLVEWDCIPEKRIVPDWGRPDRITSPAILIDENGYMAWDYLESFDDGVPLSVIDPSTGIRGEYTMELPRFLPEESLFRTKGKSTDGQSVVVEWACLPGKRRLVTTKTEGIGTIDDWASPSRIILIDEFTDEIIERGGLLAEANVKLQSLEETTIPETESPDDMSDPPLAQPYIADTVSRPAHKPRTLPKPKQTALQWT